VPSRVTTWLSADGSVWAVTRASTNAQREAWAGDASASVTKVRRTRRLRALGPEPFLVFR
jgi:hypothetical protein